MEIRISFEKKHLSFFAFLVFVVGLSIVFAYGTSNPNRFGHSLGEIDSSTCQNGEVIKKVNGVWGCGMDESGNSSWSGGSTGSFIGGDDGDWSIGQGNVYRKSGNVGVGTDNPQKKLQVIGEISGTSLCIGNDCISSWAGGGVAGTDTRCDSSGTCSQLCIGTSCRTSWPSSTGGGSSSDCTVEGVCQNLYAEKDIVANEDLVAMGGITAVGDIVGSNEIRANNAFVVGTGDDKTVIRDNLIALPKSANAPFVCNNARLGNLYFDSDENNEQNQIPCVCVKLAGKFGWRPIDRFDLSCS